MAAAAKKKKSPPAPGLSWIFWLKALSIVIVGLWALWPALPGDWDDDDEFYLADNPLRQDPAHLWKIWFQPGSFVEYYPVTETVQMAQWHFWQHDSYGYVLTNIVLHLVNALLIWRLLHLLGLRLAWLGGLIFAIHPLNVESVAWISEIKNTLSATPFLFALCFWLRYEESRRDLDYACSLSLFVLAMLCKITMAPFAFVILLYAWWKRGRVSFDDLRAALPFFLIALALGIVNYLSGTFFAAHYAQQAPHLHLDGVLAHLVLAGQSGAFYFAHFLWPWTPVPTYPKWNVDPHLPWHYLPWLGFGIMLYVSWQNRQKWGRHVLFGLLFFFLMIAPFLGVIEISFMNFTWVMDHFLYLPMIGLIGLLVAAMDQIYRKFSPPLRWISVGALTVLFVALACETHSYAGIYSTQESRFRYAVRINPNAFMAHSGLAEALLNRGDLDGALREYQEALRLNPESDDTHFRMGEALLQANRPEEARDHFQAAVRLAPKFADAYDDLGAVLLQLGHPDEAAAALQRALAIVDFAQAHNDLGNVLLQTQHPAEAEAEFRKAVALKPYVPQLHDNLALALCAEHRVPEALDEFHAALAIDPQDNAAQTALAKLQPPVPSKP